MSETLEPEELFKVIAGQVPTDLHPHILLVGSLAAAYHYRQVIKQRGVNTKDADLMVRPAGALSECARIATRLLGAGWIRHEKCWASPEGTPTEELRAIRLWPPDGAPYFIELLALPELGQQEARIWTPCALDDGCYGLPSFRYMGVLDLEPQTSKAGLGYAHPAMMALANLLSHPKVGHETMSELIGGRVLRRASKDLGRVIALAWLEGREGTQAWVELWGRALRARFADEASSLAASLGHGLRELLADPGFLDEARHAVDIGLLSGFGVTTDNLAAVGERLLVDAIEPVSKS